MTLYNNETINMTALDGKQKIKLSNILMDCLNTGDWEELFMLTDCTDFPEINNRFYQDVHWKNDSLKQGCIRAVNYILDNKNENLTIIWNLNGVQHYTRNKDYELYNIISSAIDGSCIVNTPTVTHTSKSIMAALDDAEALLKTRGAAYAYDRMHTALHGFLKQACINKGIPFNDSDAITALLPNINAFLKNKPDTGRNDKVFAMLRSANSMLDTINYLRNHHSMSHANENLLTEADAKFSINLARSIMTYIDDLVGQ
ncbi:hypothetical protein D3C72_693970 [compost metagenome]